MPRTTKSVRIRCSFFDEAGTAHKISSARLSRLCRVGNSGIGHEVIPELAGQRGKFLTVWIHYDGGVPVSVKRVDGMVLDFLPDGTVDRDKYVAMEVTAMNYVWEGLERHDSGNGNVIPSANRFAFKQYRWDPTEQEVLAALAANGIRANGRN